MHHSRCMWYKLPLGFMAVQKTNRRARTSGVKTLQGLVDLYFASGFEAVKKELAREFVMGAIDRCYWLSEEGKAVYRTDVGESKHLAFSNFNPPPLWQAPYSINLAYFRKPEHRVFRHLMYHGTEEILLPIEGEVQYCFFHSKGGEPAELKLLPKSVSGKSIIRINPQIPHSTAAVTEHAVAWMLFRDASNATARLVRSNMSPVSSKGRRSKRSDQDQLSEGQRLVSGADLKDTKKSRYRYALIAWGLAELIRNARLQSALSLDQLGKLVGLDRTSLSRLERGELNIRLDRLIAICNELDLDIATSIKASTWTHDMDTLPPLGRISTFVSLLNGPAKGHILRTFIFDLKKGQKTKFEVLHHSEYSSWIAIRGRLIADVQAQEQRDRKSLIVNERSVVHFRSPDQERRETARQPELYVEWQAIEDSRFLVVTCDDSGRHENPL